MEWFHAPAFFCEETWEHVPRSPFHGGYDVLSTASTRCKYGMDVARLEERPADERPAEEIIRLYRKQGLGTECLRWYRIVRIVHVSAASPKLELGSVKRKTENVGREEAIRSRIKDAV